MAGRVGQLFNAYSISTEIGVDVKTIQSWLSVLEKSFILFKLHPWHENFNKRLIKTPKLYFYDVGLVCNLLGIKTIHDLSVHFAKGSLFENFVILEKIKRKLNKGIQPDFFFWRDSHGNEIDIVETTGKKQVITEVKSSKTIKQDFFKRLDWYEQLASTYSIEKQLIYGGEITQQRSNNIKVISWKDIN